MTKDQANQKLQQWAMWSCNELAKLRYAYPNYVTQIKPVYPDPPPPIPRGEDAEMLIVDAAIARLGPIPKKTIERHFRYQRIYSQAMVDYAVRRFIDVYLDIYHACKQGMVMAACIAPMIMDPRY